MTEPLRIIENPEVSFDDSPITGVVEEATIYPSGVVQITAIERGERVKMYYPPHKAPVVKDGI